MIKVSTTGMAVSLKTDLRFPISGQWGHGDRIIHHGAEFGAEREFIFLMMAIYLVNSLVVKKYRFRNEIIVGISIILSLALCNLLVLCR